MAAEREAKALNLIREQMNAKAPNRATGNDGTFGDKKHRARKSDHNPDSRGVVVAIDITHDPRNGIDAHKIADHCIANPDRRYRYIISNSRIAGNAEFVKENPHYKCPGPWRWGKYDGPSDHSEHTHWSLRHEPEFCDDVTQTFDLGLDSILRDPTAPSVPNFPLLMSDATGADVGVLQQMLNLSPVETKTLPAQPDERTALQKWWDNFLNRDNAPKAQIVPWFGPRTEAAAETFQRDHGLDPDGKVGPYTWKALIAARGPIPVPIPAPGPAPVPVPVITPEGPRADLGLVGLGAKNVYATTFGGSAELERSAYDGKKITQLELGCALPGNLAAPRPDVLCVNRFNGRSVVVKIRDKGPWMIDDPYWLAPGKRPAAETSYNNKTKLTSGPNKGRVARNKAGIDLTPAVFKALGMTDNGYVDWQFVEPGSGVGA